MTNLHTVTERLEDTGPAALVSEHRWPGRSLYWANLAGALATLVFGGLVLVSSRAYQVRVGALPGPGMYPRLVGWGIVILAVVWLAQAVRSGSGVQTASEPVPDKTAFVRGVLSLALIFAFAFVLRPVGYLLSTFGLVTLLVLLASGSRRKAFVTGTAFAVGTQLLVTTGLGIPLPLGVLEPFLQ